MRENPKVAVYMSCYNHEKYVSMAVDSVLQQTYSNLEFFIVNDGSTDGSGRILESYTDERIHYFDFKKNTRFVGASNFLMKIMREQDVDYIACIASDDMWELDKLEKQITFLQGHPEYRACFTWDRLEYSQDWTGGQWDEQYSHKKNQNRYDWLYHFYWEGNCMNACSALIDKEAFYEIGGMNETYLALGDYRAWMLLAARYPFYLMESALTIYRRHGSNLSSVPTAGIMLRKTNEMYKISREIMMSMDMRTFRRAFYQDLIYTQCNSREELLAEKFIVLINRFNMCVCAQTALDIYYENSENELFLSILEDRYFFDAVDFIEFTDNAGILLSVNAIMGANIVPWSAEKIKRCNPGLILLNALAENKVSAETLPGYRYTTLLDLYTRSLEYEGGEEQFQHIKQQIGQIRNQRISETKRKILFITAGDSARNLSGIAEELGLDQEDDLAVAFVYKKEYYFTDNPVQPDPERIPERMRYVNLYNETEHCLYFPEELGEEADVIYYVDCLEPEYECGNMLAGYPLHIRCNCVLSMEIYEKLFGQKSALLGVMEELYT